VCSSDLGSRAVTKRAVPQEPEPAPPSQADIDKLIEQRVDEKLKEMFKLLDGLGIPSNDSVQPKEMMQQQSTSGSVLKI
jgi:hypothetical protein